MSRLAGSIISQPEPRAINSRLPLGVRYFPGWQDGTRWVTATPARWPIRGNYDENLQAVCDAQLLEMNSFGFDYISLCWFWDPPTSSMYLGHWFQNYFASTVLPKPKLMLYFDNTGLGITAAEWKIMIAWLVANYANRPEVQRVDGKAVISIHSPASLKATSAAGGTDAGVAAILNQARAAGPFYFACSTVESVMPFAQLLKTGPGSALAQGYDAVDAYNIISGTNWDTFMRGWTNWHREVLATCPLPCFLPMTAGWDNTVEMGGFAITNPNINDFESGLRATKAFADIYRDRVKGMCITAWNEYLEGAVIEPASLYGGTARGLKIKQVFER